MPPTQIGHGHLWLKPTCRLCERWLLWLMLIMMGFLSSCRTHQRGLGHIDEDSLNPPRQLDVNHKPTSHTGADPILDVTTDIRSIHEFTVQKTPIEIIWYSGCNDEYARTIQNEINNFAYLLEKTDSTSKIVFISCRGTSWLTYNRLSPRIQALNRQIASDGHNILTIAKQDLAAGGDLNDFFSPESLKVMIMTLTSKPPQTATSFIPFLANLHDGDTDHIRFFGLYHMLITDPESIHPRYKNIITELDGRLIALHHHPVSWHNLLWGEISSTGHHVVSQTKYPINKILSVSINGQSSPLNQIYYRANQIKLKPGLAQVGDVVKVTYAIDKADTQALNP